MLNRTLAADRYEIASPDLLSRDIAPLLLDRRITTLQTNLPLTEHTCSLLDADFFAVRPDVEFRVYGRHFECCDLALVRRMPHVERFRADCLRDALHVEAIAELPRLRELGLGIWSLQSFDVLDLLPPTMEALDLQGTKSKRPRLRGLARFPRLKRLHIEGHRRDIEVVGALRELQQVSLRSVSTPGVEWLTTLPALGDLRIVLGGIRSFAALRRLQQIRTLAIRFVLGLDDLSFVSDMVGLELLVLQNQPRITSMPDLHRLTRLATIQLEHMVGLRDFTALEHAPALESFHLIDGRAQAVADLLPLMRNRSVKRCLAGFGSDRRNHEFMELTRQHGKSAQS